MFDQRPLLLEPNINSYGHVFGFKKRHVNFVIMENYNKCEVCDFEKFLDIFCDFEKFHEFSDIRARSDIFERL